MSPKVPWSFGMTLSLGMYFEMRTTRVQSQMDNSNKGKDNDTCTLYYTPSLIRPLHKIKNKSHWNIVNLGSITVSSIKWPKIYHVKYVILRNSSSSFFRSASLKVQTFLQSLSLSLKAFQSLTGCK